MTIEERQKIEREIVEAVIDSALAAGYSISVEDGDSELAIERSKDRAAILAEMFQMDDDTLRFHEGDREMWNGWVYFVYGNDGWDVVNDNSTNVEHLLRSASVLIEKYEAIA